MAILPPRHLFGERGLLRLHASYRCPFGCPGRSVAFTRLGPTRTKAICMLCGLRATFEGMTPASRLCEQCRGVVQSAQPNARYCGSGCRNDAKQARKNAKNPDYKPRKQEVP